MKGLFNILYLDSFTLFPEYFIGVSIIYVLIVVVLITYNVYGLMLQKAISECLALVMFMACYLLLNDDLISFGFVSFYSSIINDHFAFFTKFIICFSSGLFFLIISNFLKYHRITSFEYLIILLFAILGLILLCSSYDLLTAYLAIELSSLASYVLASFKKTSSYSVESGLKYFITGAISSAFFLLGSSFIYSVIGSISLVDFKTVSDTILVDMPKYDYFYNMALTENDLSTKVLAYLCFNAVAYGHPTLYPQFHNFLADVGLSLIIFSLFIKLGLAPFHLWSLDVYEGSPTSSTFFFAVISKLSFFVLLFRLCHQTFLSLMTVFLFYSSIIMILSVFVGSFGGLKTRKLKTLLAYSSTSHMGYTMLAFMSFDRMISIEMGIFYLVIYMLTGLCTWFIILSLRLKNKSVKNKYSLELGDLVLLYRSNSALAFSFALTVFSMSGIPPLIGFLAKLGVFFSVILTDYYWLPLIAILCSVVSTFYYIRIIKVLYFENVLVGKLYYPIENQKILILSILTFLLVFLFINPTILFLNVIKVVEFYF